jgi:hypothetical protein
MSDEKKPSQKKHPKYPALSKIVGSDVIDGIAGIATIHDRVLAETGGYVPGAALAKTFEESTECLKAAGVEFLVAGGFGFGFLVEPAATRDVDLMVLAGEDAQEVLKKSGFKVEMTGGEIKDRFHVEALSKYKGAVVELLVCTKTDFSKFVFARAVSVGGYKVPSPEDMILFALLGFRGKDKARIHQVLEKYPQVDLVYIRARIRDIPVKPHASTWFEAALLEPTSG